MPSIRNRVKISLRLLGKDRHSLEDIKKEPMLCIQFQNCKNIQESGPVCFGELKSSILDKVLHFYLELGIGFS